MSKSIGSAIEELKEAIFEASVDIKPETAIVEIVLKPQAFDMVFIDVLVSTPKEDSFPPSEVIVGGVKVRRSETWFKTACDIVARNAKDPLTQEFLGYLDRKQAEGDPLSAFSQPSFVLNSDGKVIDLSTDE